MIAKELEGLRHFGGGQGVAGREVSLKHPTPQRASRRPGRLRAGVLAALIAIPAGAEIDGEGARRELSRIGAAIRALEKDLAAARAERSTAQRDLERHERAISRLVNEQRALARTAGALEAELGGEQSQSL